jgi:hypothetical protein
MKYNTAIEHDRADCLPPEVYIRLIRKAANSPQPKFRSSVYPNPNIKSIPYENISSKK